MLRGRRVDLQTYRDQKIDVFDDGGVGWSAVIHALADSSGGRGRKGRMTLRDSVPNGLPVLVEEARRKGDLTLDRPSCLGT